jgi:hypothetical protein
MQPATRSCSRLYWLAIRSSKRPRYGVMFYQRWPTALSPTGRLAARSGDPDSALWIKERLQGVAAGLRAKKKWLAVPKADTQKQFSDWMTLFFYQLATADWDAMEQEAARTITALERIKIVGKRVAVVALNILVPVTLFLAAERSPTLLTSPVKACRRPARTVGDVGHSLGGRSDVREAIRVVA